MHPHLRTPLLPFRGISTTARPLLATTLAALLVTLAPRVAEAQMTPPEPISIVAGYPIRVHGSTRSTRAPRSEDDRAPLTGIDRDDCESN